MTARWQRRRFRWTVAGVAAMVLTLVAFAPVVRHLNSTVLLVPGDATSSARDYWAAHELGKTPFSLVQDKLLDAPEGQQSAPAVQIANGLQPVFVVGTWRIAGWLGAFNLFMLFGVAATLFAMFALLDSFGLHPVAAAAGALAFGWSQWCIEQLLYGHVAFAQLWVYPLLLGSLLWARRGATVRALVPGLAFALCFYAFSYLGLFAALLVGVFLLLELAQRRWSVERASILRLAWGGAAAFAALLPVLLASRIAPSSVLGLPRSSKRDLNGAPIHDYFIPSTHNPFYGHLVKLLFGTHVGETVTFFGYTVLGLALVAAALAIRGWSGASRPVRFAVVLIPIAWFASLPAYPYIYGLSFPVPDAAYIIGAFVQWWRIYTRFAVLVGFGLTILAAVSLDRLFRRGATVAASLLVALVVIEAVPGLPLPTTRLRSDATVQWLIAHPGGTVAFYPLLSTSAPVGGTSAAWDNYVWGTLYDQVNYKHPLFSLPRIEAVADRTTEIRLLASDPLNPATPGILAAEKVRWVVVRTSVYHEIGDKPPQLGSGYRLVAQPPGSRIYRVTAAPVDLTQELAARTVELARDYAVGSAEVSYGKGFYGPERHDKYVAHWMSQNAQLVVSPLIARGFVTFQLTIRAFANATPRRLTVFDGSRSLGTFFIPTSEATLTIPLQLPDASTALTLHVDPGPARISRTDPRIVSVYVELAAADPVGVVLAK